MHCQPRSYQVSSATSEWRIRIKLMVSFFLILSFITLIIIQKSLEIPTGNNMEISTMTVTLYLIKLIEY